MRVDKSGRDQHRVVTKTEQQATAGHPVRAGWIRSLTELLRGLRLLSGRHFDLCACEQAGVSSAEQKKSQSTPRHPSGAVQLGPMGSWKLSWQTVWVVRVDGRLTELGEGGGKARERGAGDFLRPARAKPRQLRAARPDRPRAQSRISLNRITLQSGTLDNSVHVANITVNSGTSIKL